MPNVINNTIPTPVHASTHEPDFVAAAHRVVAEVDAMAPDDIEALNRDFDAVVATVLGANRVIQPFLSELAKLPTLDVERIRKLGDYVDALLYWSASATYAVPAKPELAAMAEKGVEIRERTIHDLGALTRHGFLPKELVETFGGSTGYRQVAHDLVGLSNLVHERWASIGGKTLITLEAMDEAAALGKRMMQAIGDREVAQAEAARDVVRRNKAYSLVMRTYSELRGAMSFLRRKEGDVDQLVPSLFAQNRASKKRDEAQAATSAGVATATDELGPRTTSLLVPDPPNLVR